MHLRDIVAVLILRLQLVHFMLPLRCERSTLTRVFCSQVKKQHMERNVQFLADELKVSTAAEAKDRVYFVSAREALICRLQSAGVVPGTPGTPGTYSTTHVYVIMQLAGILSIRL